MSEIVMVTAFFDIGRGEEQIMPRKTEKYFNDFSFWARIQNDLIVFTSSEYKEKIMGIRSGFGRSSETVVEVIDDIWKIEPDLFSRMKKVEENRAFLRWRQRPDSSDNQAKYNYITMLKFYFMMKASELINHPATIAWIDFGYNHGGQVYTVPEEFNFKWKYDFGEKINLFAFRDTWREDTFGAAVLQSMVAVLSASIMTAPGILCAKYYSLIKKSMEALLMLDCMDDDQMLMLMAYRQAPELFEIKLHKGWHWVLKEYGGEHLTVKEQRNTSVSFMGKLKLWIFSPEKLYRLSNYFIRKILDIAPEKVYWARLERLISEYHEM